MQPIAVLMPTYRQAAFIRRAIDSLRAQTWSDWELWVLDDGSPDDTGAAVRPELTDPRLRYLRFEQNMGLGAALNLRLARSQAPYIAYLPSDDLYFAGHLASLVAALEANPQAALAYSGVRHHYNRSAEGQIPGTSLQLVQVLHRRSSQRWMERDELVTDDLERMYWGKLRLEGEFIATGQVTCEWVDHPFQRHKLLREPVGGLNRYRSYYQVRQPIRMHTQVGNLIDEVAQYRRFRDLPGSQPAERPTGLAEEQARLPEEQASLPPVKDVPAGPVSAKHSAGLKILLAGELAYNPERVLAFEERGHRLYGLWMPDPYWYNTVGPLPFGHVQDLSYPNWREEVRRIRPDVIYALLNWQAVPFARRVLEENPGIPFVWHYKEGPFISIEKGHWEALVDLYLKSDGLVYTSPEMQSWFETVLPPLAGRVPSLVLDGDLPKQEWFQYAPAETRLSERDGELHTLVPGRPIGLHPENVAELAGQGIHLHFYGDFTQGQWLEWIEKTRRLAPRHIHLHAHVDQSRWVQEFSQYDAGWLHYFQSENKGDLRRANWDDLNYPARIATLAAAGLPLLQRDNTGSIVATQSLARALDIGLFFTQMAELRAQLSDTRRMAQLRANMAAQRGQFVFDTHTDRLVQFFQTVIQKHESQRASSASSRYSIRPPQPPAGPVLNSRRNSF